MKDKIKKILLESIQVKEKLIQNYTEKILEITEAIIDSLKKGGKVILFGNGGSAADSQHIAAELIGRFKKDRQALPAIALTTDTSILTSLANDYGYETIFEKQIEGLAKKEDIVIAISTSGKAKNVIRAIDKAKKMGIKTISFTGKGGGELTKITDISLVVPSNSTARIQEAHITVGHIICEIIEDTFCNDKK
ncbi:MAG: D-sedoheptulose 7-phosphate isomerase [Candidatus Omnitrophica bacterium]|nr:D-sedoheptulose 7-phosphate isomerase [Candidatus Omnitrophota bacterium]